MRQHIQGRIDLIDTEFKELRDFTKEKVFELTVQVDGFKEKVEAVKKRFLNLVADFDLRLKIVDKKEKMSEEIIKAFRDELLSQARITSMLVELDFMQQSLDF